MAGRPPQRVYRTWSSDSVTAIMMATRQSCGVIEWGRSGMGSSVVPPEIIDATRPVQ